MVGIVLMSFQEDPHQKLFFQGSKFCKMANSIIKRVSGASRASEAFSLVMKTNKCLRLRVLTRNACLNLAYVSSPAYVASTGVCVLNWHTFQHLANMSSSRIDVDVFQRPPPLLGMRTKNYAPTIPCSTPLKVRTVTVVWRYGQMPLCRTFQRHFNKVHTRNCSFI